MEKIFEFLGLRDLVKSERAHLLCDEKTSAQHERRAPEKAQPRDGSAKS